MIRQCSMGYKLEYKNIQPTKRRTQFLKSSTIENQTRPIENRRHDFSTEFKLGPSAWKRLGFQSNTTRYKKKTLTTFSHIWETLKVLLWDLKGIVPSSSKVTTRNHSHTIRISRYEDDATKINNCWWFKPLSVVLETQTREFVLLNLWVGSQSHKCGCLCKANPKEKEFMDSELARGRVNKLLLEVEIDLGLNMIVKTSIFYSGFILLWG